MRLRSTWSSKEQASIAVLRFRARRLRPGRRRWLRHCAQWPTCAQESRWGSFLWCCQPGLLSVKFQIPKSTRVASRGIPDDWWKRATAAYNSDEQTRHLGLLARSSPRWWCDMQKGGSCGPRNWVPAPARSLCGWFTGCGGRSYRWCGWCKERCQKSRHRWRQKGHFSSSIRVGLTVYPSRTITKTIALTHRRGLVGVGGFIPYSYLSNSDPSGTTTMTFGYNGFFGYGACSAAPSTSHNAATACIPGSRAVWWSTYSLPTPPSPDDLDKIAFRDDLQARYASWKDPIIQMIISEARIDSIYPAWTTPELPTWEAGGLVLVGDAAHALQTSSGQGISQALEDVQALSMLLADYLQRTDSCAGSFKEPLELASKAYCKLRMPRVKRIMDHAMQMGDMKREKGVLAEYIMYLFIWIKGLVLKPWLWEQVCNLLT